MSTDSGEQPVMIMAGGTGGHVFPALAVAEQLKRRGIPLLWLGTRKGLEATIIPPLGIPVIWLPVHGLRGRSIQQWLIAPWRIGWAVIKVARALRRERPLAVLGMGGYVSGPGGIAARLCHIPLIIHEQNARPGLTNRILCRIANRCYTAYPQVFPDRLVTAMIGNPVRNEIAELPSPEQRWRERTGSIRILILGGSQGAACLNRIVPVAIGALKPMGQFLIWHQCGKSHEEPTREIYRSLNLEAQIDPFIHDMASAYSWADIVICRAGALTLAELAAAGLGAILIPYPYAADDHQTLNARWMVKRGAAFMISESELTQQELTQTLRDRVSDRLELLNMAQCARKQAPIDAQAELANACIEAGEKK